MRRRCGGGTVPHYLQWEEVRKEGKGILVIMCYTNIIVQCNKEEVSTTAWYGLSYLCHCYVECGLLWQQKRTLSNPSIFGGISVCVFSKCKFPPTFRQLCRLLLGDLMAGQPHQRPLQQLLSIVVRTPGHAGGPWLIDRRTEPF
jgi:hypothetical protein